jgi:hypothetical protein
MTEGLQKSGIRKGKKQRIEITENMLFRIAILEEQPIRAKFSPFKRYEFYCSRRAGS